MIYEKLKDHFLLSLLLFGDKKQTQISHHGARAQVTGGHVHVLSGVLIYLKKHVFTNKQTNDSKITALNNLLLIITVIIKCRGVHGDVPAEVYRARAS